MRPKILLLTANALVVVKLMSVMLLLLTESGNIAEIPSPPNIWTPRMMMTMMMIDVFVNANQSPPTNIPLANFNNLNKHQNINK